ncbi:MAG TPA: YCF48-related protein [Thermoanaerobaculia bacterium]|nr:YCF48-related protein [Thermoanaerobaculia bacterium]
MSSEALLKRPAGGRRRSQGLAVAILGLALVVPSVAVAAGPAGSSWHPEPIFGGDVRTLAISPDDPDVVFAGTTAGQLYVSRNGGRSWDDAGAPLPFPGWVVGKLQFDPNWPSRLWVALWGVWGSGQAAFSDDLGAHWVARSQGLPDEPVYTLALTPGQERRLYAGTRSGVWGSEDGGLSWRHLTADLPDIQKVTSLLVDPSQPETVIAGTWRQAYRSEDGGRTWAGVFNGMVLDTELFSLTPIPERPGEIWASTCGWVYQTKDRGSKWERFKDGLEERRTTSFAALPDGRLLAGTVSGLFISTDGGHTWGRRSDPALAVMAIAYSPARPDRVILGTEGSGVWISTDGTKSFLRASEGMTNTRVGALARSGDEVLVAVNDAGPISGVYVSRDRGRTFSGIFSPLPTVLDLAVREGRAYAATERGLYQRLGQDWHRVQELGEQRVEQILTADGALVVRTGAGLYEWKGDRFAPVAWKHGPPRSAAVYGNALWVTDAQGVYRLTRDANHTITSPFAGGQIHRLGDQLLLAGAGGAWALSTDPAPMWVQLTDKACRIVDTGSPRYPALVIAGEELALYDPQAKALKPLPLDVPARDITSALILDGSLMLGTSGYGVLVRELE